MTTTSRIGHAVAFPAAPYALAIATAVALALAGCNRSPPANPPSAAAPSSQSGPQTVLGRTVETAMAKARHELETGNLDLSNGPDINFDKHGRHFRIGNSTDGSKAQLTPQGDLLIDGKAVAVTPEQRAMLLEYRKQIIDIAETGMAIGVQGADLAGKAVLDTFAGLMHGDAEAAGKRIEAEGKRIEAQAKVICSQLPPMLATQQRLAASLAAFKPYANMTREDIDDCMKGDGASVTSADGSGIRDEVREQVRERIRSTVRRPSNDSADTDASDADKAQQAH